MLAETLEDTTETALARSAFYGVMASAFRHPDSARFRTFAGREECDALSAALFCVDSPYSEAMRAAISDLSEAARCTSHEAMVVAHVRLFGHTARRQVPPYETEYGTGGPFFQPQEMSDIVGFYRAFGLDVDPGKHERLDHIACESEFMCFLCAKEAHALDEKDDSAAEVARQAQRLFLRDHMGAFARTFLTNLSSHTAAPWHVAAAAFCNAFLEAECKRLGLTIGRRYLTLRPIEEVDVPMACGSCDGPCESAEMPEG